MKAKKLLLTAFAAACLLAGTAALAACGEKEPAPAPEPEAHTHTYGKWAITAPTMTEQGSAKKVCDSCEEGTEGHELTVTLPVLTDESYTVTGDTATCEGSGRGLYVCAVEGIPLSFEAETAPKGHAYHEHAAVEPTCQSTGNKAYYTCDNCTKVFDENKTACESGAWDLPVAAHKLGARVEEKAPTCTETGTPAYYECEVCHHHFADDRAENEISDEDFVIPEAHTYVEYAAKDATCLEGGNTKYYQCSACEAYFDEDKAPCKEGDWIVEALGHNTPQEQYTPAQNNNHCIEIWEDEHWYCTRCEQYLNGNKEVSDDWRQRAPLGHDFTGVDKTPEKPATCTEDGMPAYYVCNRCHEHYATNETAVTNNKPVQATPSTGHHWVSDGELGDPSEAGGKISVKCSNADCTETKEIDYSGTLALTGTQAATAVQIDGAGQYYVKGTAAQYAYFSIPITKAGTYRVEFINLDASRFLTTNSGSPVLIYDSSRQVGKGGSTNSGKTFTSSLAATYGTLTGELGGNRDFRWFELQTEETLVGGKVTFTIYFSGATADSPFPVVIDVQIADAATASISAQEYAVLPGKVALIAE